MEKIRGVDDGAIIRKRMFRTWRGLACIGGLRDGYASSPLPCLNMYCSHRLISRYVAPRDAISGTILAISMIPLSCCKKPVCFRSTSVDHRFSVTIEI